MQSGWERLAKLAALLLPAVALVAWEVDPSLRARCGDAVSWVCLALGGVALAWFLVVVLRTRAPQHGEGPWLQSLAPEEQKAVKRSWRIGTPVPTGLVENVRRYGRTQEVALHRSGWTLVAIAFFNMNTAFSDGTLRWLGVAVLVYFIATGLALDLVLARWQRVLRSLPSEDSIVESPRPG